MAHDKVFRLIEVEGTSPNSMEEAMENAITEASRITPNMKWFELMSTRGMLENNRIVAWRVTIKIRASV